MNDSMKEKVFAIIDSSCSELAELTSALVKFPV